MLFSIPIFRCFAMIAFIPFLSFRMSILSSLVVADMSRTPRFSQQSDVLSFLQAGVSVRPLDGGRILIAWFHAYWSFPVLVSSMRRLMAFGQLIMLLGQLQFFLGSAPYWPRGSMEFAMTLVQLGKAKLIA